MGIRIRPYRRGGWEVDIVVAMPDGTRLRERKKAPVSSRSSALRWAEARERQLLVQGIAKPEKDRREVPTLAAFAPRFLEGYAVANRQKPSGIAAKETILRVHLVPRLGKKRLSEITNEDVQRLKGKLAHRSTKTTNNVLSVLSTVLRIAVEWNVLEVLPCTVRLLKSVPPTEASFHDFVEFERLVEAARKVDRRAYLIVLLGGEAGLRCGEIQALEWTDIDLDRRQLWVRRSDWKGHVSAPKGGRARLVPLTSRLAEGLRSHRHLKGPRVLTREDGEGISQKIVRVLVERSARLANLRNAGVHVLRHTFCSHLAMRGAPTRAIQELAGHKDLSTSQRYMHLSPAAVEAAIRLLEQPKPAHGLGDGVETGVPSKVKPLGPK